MQVFIASGRVAFIPNDAVGRTPNGHVSFKFEFVCDSSMTDDTNKPISSFFHVQVYGKQAEFMAQSLSLIHISEPTRLHKVSRMPSSA